MDIYNLILTPIIELVLFEMKLGILIHKNMGTCFGVATSHSLHATP